MRRIYNVGYDPMKRSAPMYEIPEIPQRCNVRNIYKVRHNPMKRSAPMCKMPEIPYGQHFVLAHTERIRCLPAFKVLAILTSNLISKGPHPEI